MGFNSAFKGFRDMVMYEIQADNNFSLGSMLQSADCVLTATSSTGPYLRAPRSYSH